MAFDAGSKRYLSRVCGGYGEQTISVLALTAQKMVYLKSLALQQNEAASTEGWSWFDQEVVFYIDCCIVVVPLWEMSLGRIWFAY